MTLRNTVFRSLLATALSTSAVPLTAEACHGPANSASGSPAVADATHNAFGRALGNLDVRNWPRMLAGKRVFTRIWKPPGQGPETEDGLGPLFNAASCPSCHFKDGRGGRKPSPATSPPLIFRLDPTASHGWGSQLQNKAVGGLSPEAQVEIDYHELKGNYPDGKVFRLHRPTYRINGLETSPRLSPRLPPTLIGMGLLEAVGAETIQAWADPWDIDGDGISGRVAWLMTGGERQLGRFGWKAARPSLADQVAGALAEDMGISSVRYPVAGDPGRNISPTSPNEDPEISIQHFNQLIDYLRFLAPPAQRSKTPDSVKGEEIFREIGCAACHRPSLVTAAARSSTMPAELAGQKFFPYTDLLLHDLGPGLADDGIGEPFAEAGEWRTAPLWGLGLLPLVNGALYLLHDGRAGSFEEAILWHGGEALATRERFRNLAQEERRVLLLWLRAL